MTSVPRGGESSASVTGIVELSQCCGGAGGDGALIITSLFSAGWAIVAGSTYADLYTRSAFLGCLPLPLATKNSVSMPNGFTYWILMVVVA